MLETSSATVGRVRERFWRQGLDAALERSMPDRAYERTFDGRAEANADCDNGVRAVPR